MRRLIVGVMCVLPTLVDAQPPAPRVISDDASCPRCTISVRPLVRLGAPDGDASLTGVPTAVQSDSRGRYWVLLWHRTPLVFDAAGTFIGNVRRLGVGPGEFQFAQETIPIPGDSMLVIDTDLRRATIVSSELRPARSVQLRIPIFTLGVSDWPNAIVKCVRVWRTHGGRLAAASGVVQRTGRCGHDVLRHGQYSRQVAGGDSADTPIRGEREWVRVGGRRFPIPARRVDAGREAPHHGGAAARVLPGDIEGDDRLADVATLADDPGDPRGRRGAAMGVRVGAGTHVARRVAEECGPRRDSSRRARTPEAVPDDRRGHRSACGSCGRATSIGRVGYRGAPGQADREPRRRCGRDAAGRDQRGRCGWPRAGCR